MPVRNLLVFTMLLAVIGTYARHVPKMIAQMFIVQPLHEFFNSDSTGSEEEAPALAADSEKVSGNYLPPPSLDPLVTGDNVFEDSSQEIEASAKDVVPTDIIPVDGFPEIDDRSSYAESRIQFTDLIAYIGHGARFMSWLFPHEEDQS